jgi:hypothetical protein
MSWLCSGGRISLLRLVYFDILSSPRWKRRATLCIAQTVLLLAPAFLAARQVSTPKPEAAPSTPAPEQPTPFSHKTHLSFRLSCVFCHENPEPGNQMTLPAAQTCMGCHSRVASDRPSVQQLAKFAASKQPIPWKPVYSVPAFVYWSHRTHLQGGVTCAMCHGDVAQMEIITKATNVTTMAGCVACHRQKGAATGCETCHESQSSLLSRPGARRETAGVSLAKPDTQSSGQ